MSVLRSAQLLRRASQHINSSSSSSFVASRCGSRLQLARAAARGTSACAGQPGAPDVRELARLAHITVTDEEVADWQPKIAGIVEWFGQLQEIDVEGVPPALRADVQGDSRLRSDEPCLGGPRGVALLEQAADWQGDFVRVPKIATAADE